MPPQLDIPWVTAAPAWFTGGVGGSQGAPAERSGDSFQLVADLWALFADFELVQVLSVVAVAHLDDVQRAAGCGVQLDVAQLDQVME